MQMMRHQGHGSEQRKMSPKMTSLFVTMMSLFSHHPVSSVFSLLFQSLGNLSGHVSVLIPKWGIFANVHREFLQPHKDTESNLLDTNNQF